MRQLVGTSDHVIGRLDKMAAQSSVLKSAMTDLGGSVYSLRQKMELLRSEKELIHPSNMRDIKKYNREIASLERQINKLDNAGRGGVLSRITGGLSSRLGGSIRPIEVAATAAAATIGYAVKNAMTLDEQFAKVNVTAQLEGADFDKLKQDIIDTAKKNKVDVMTAPMAFEKIISQTGDADLSLQILDSTLKGSKAGFTEVSVVADALSQSLSIVGKDSATASEILDTFFAAKRVGAGEFGDFARYMPGLIASADALGIKYKEVAGIFAYMTGMGQSAERAATLMNNMFSILGRGEVTDKLKKAGVNVFDNGQMRSSVDIFRDLAGVMDTMNSEQKSGFIEALGIVDKEAKSAFMVMTADVDKLQNSLTDCANASGETDRALELAANTAQRAREVWASFKNSLVAVGTGALPLVNAGLDAAEWVLNAVKASVKGITGFFGGWYNLLRDGNPLVWAATTAIGLLNANLLISQARLIGVTTWTKIKVAWDTILSTGSRIAATSVAFFNTTMLATPWGMALVGISAVAAALIGMRSRTDDSTKSFAAFNAELHSSKKESGDMFEAAQKAALGSRERAEAIAAINDRYREYLPNMLAESATNEEIAATLTVVNGKLGENIRLKYVKQEKEASEGVYIKEYNSFFERLNYRLEDKSQEEQFAINANVADMINEDVPNAEISKYLTKQGVDVKTSRNLLGFNVKQVNDVVDWDLTLLKRAKFDRDNRNRIIDAQFMPRSKPTDLPPPPLPGYALPNSAQSQETPAPQVSVFNIYNSKWSTDGVLSPFIARPAESPQSPVAGETAQSLPAANSQPDGGTAPVAYNDFINHITGGKIGSSNGGGATSSVFNLDQIVADKKGSTAYNAVIAKIGKVGMSSLAAASMATAVATSPALSMPPVSEASTTNIARAAVDGEDYGTIGSRGRTLDLEKFCDQIVINIAKADNEGVDEIRTKVMEVLKEVIDGYNA